MFWHRFSRRAHPERCYARFWFFRCGRGPGGIGTESLLTYKAKIRWIGKKNR